jgi:hypothetical protein
MQVDLLLLLLLLSGHHGTLAFRGIVSAWKCLVGDAGALLMT